MDVLIKTVDNLKNENEKLRTELENRTSTVYIINQIKKWFYDLF